MKKDITAPYESSIDWTDFGTVRSYLDHPNSPIQYILSVKDPVVLPQLAARLDEAMGSAQPGAVRNVLTPLFQEGSLKISARQPLQAPFPGAELAASSIPRTASCQVIYLPPFYLAHTPGLFEGKFNVHQAEHASADLPKAAPEPRNVEPQQQKHHKANRMSH